MIYLSLYYTFRALVKIPFPLYGADTTIKITYVYVETNLLCYLALNHVILLSHCV